jgi:Caspase domain
VADEPRRYLLAVGITEFDLWPPLHEVPQELERVVKILTNPPYKFERILQPASEAPDVEDLGTQLTNWANSSERARSDQLVIYWTGHGEEQREQLHLILRHSGDNPLTRTMLFERLVDSALPQQRSSGGIFLLLDVCYSGQGGIDTAQRLGAFNRSHPSDNMPQIAVLSASRPREKARQSAFSEAFARALEECERNAQEDEPYLYLDKLLHNLKSVLPATQTPVLTGQWHSMGVFPNPKFDRERWGKSIPATVAPNGGNRALEIVIIAREQGSNKLIDTAKSALNRGRTEIQQKSPKNIGDPPRVQLLDAGRAFDEEVTFRRHLAQLCRADLVIADVTKDAQNRYEPGPMLLLGIRSVARRGITICSVDSELDGLYKYDLPYNLTYLNLSSHADPHRDGPKLLSKKIETGFSQYASNPSYLDLPSYDAIRNLGNSLDSYAPIDFHQGPLYLGPFDEGLDAECFRPIEQELLVALEHIAKHRLGRNYTTEPTIRRLLDRSAAQLVARSLYEAIRRHNFCIVDWSGLRANVFFELGIRLAVREEGAVNIAAKGRPLDQGLKQVEHLSRLFKPILYDHDDFENKSRSVKEILGRREERWAKQLNARIYREVAEAVEPEARAAIVKLREELSARAKLSFIDDQDTRRTTALHADLNQDVQRAAISKSIGLTLCELMLRAGLESHYAGQDPTNLNGALAREVERVKDLAESNGDPRDIEALRRICALLKAALEAES